MTEPSVAQLDARDVDGRKNLPTRVSRAWIGMIAGALVFVLFLIFILQNTRTVKVSYFTLTATMPLGVALLLGAILGLLLAGGVASLRIWQLRHRISQGPAASQDRVDLRLRRSAPWPRWPRRDAWWTFHDEWEI